MRSWNRIFAGLLLGFVVLTSSTLGNPLEITEKFAWVGGKVDLECGDGGPNLINRIWKNGDDVVAVGTLRVTHDDRIQPVNGSAILRIANVTLVDEGQYTCIVQSTPRYNHTIQLHIKEALCEAPKHPLNGGYILQSVSDEGQFKFNDKIRFYCNPGFELIGEALLTCRGPPKGWSAEEPQCKPKNNTQAFCEAPKHPLNGGYILQSVSDDGRFKFNDKIRFYCNSGFELIGEALHTCRGPPKGWSAEEPQCKSKNNTQPEKCCDRLQSDVTNIDNKMTIIMDRVARIDNRLSDYETKQNDLSNLFTTNNSNLTLFKIIMSEIDSFKEQRLKDGQLATVGFNNGSVVSKFTWMVHNIEQEITKAKGNESYYISSMPFYTNVPGYRVKLQLNPSDRNSGYVGVYMFLVKGEFDNVLLWPFSYRYELVSVSREGNQIAHQLVNPPIEKLCPVAFLQPPKNEKACGGTQYIKIETLLANKDKYLINGALSIQLNVWLN